MTIPEYKFGEWHPIATAKKDGPQILGTDGRSVRTIEWIETPEFKSGKGWTDHTVQSWGYEEYAEYFPTHWMPLPPPPSLLGK